MAGLRKTVFRAGLETLYFSGAHAVLRPFLSGVGVILTLHHVRPPRADGFQPNRLLEVSPDFFAQLVAQLRGSGRDIVSLDEMHRRLVERDFARPFVCITFDDGYRDVMFNAYPVLKAHKLPFAMYVPTSFPEGAGELWWLGLEAVIARHDRIELVMDGEERQFECRDDTEKRALFETLYWWLRGLPTYEAIRGAVRDLCARYHVDLAAICAAQCMTWDELGRLAQDPLVTIGAHTVTHPMLAKLTAEDVRIELDRGRQEIEAKLGVRPVHLSYPVGDPTSAGPREFAIAAELGFKTAVTTQPGMLFPEHRDHLTALPRISINGEFQQMRYVQVLLSGAATAMWNGFRRVKAA